MQAFLLEAISALQPQRQTVANILASHAAGELRVLGQ